MGIPDPPSPLPDLAILTRAAAPTTEAPTLARMRRRVGSPYREPHGLPAASSSGGAAKGREEGVVGGGDVPSTRVAHAGATLGQLTHHVGVGSLNFLLLACVLLAQQGAYLM